MSQFQYYTSATYNQWYFRLKGDGPGVILFSAEGYNTTQECLTGIELVKKYGTAQKNYWQFKDLDDKYYFTVLGPDEEPIGISEPYKTSHGRNRGMTECMIHVRLTALFGRTPVVRLKEVYQG